jgi:hypothetical protein
MYFENLNGARDLYVEERIILKCIFVKWVIKSLMELNSLWPGSNG